MNRIDEYNWLLEDIDNTLIFILKDGKEMLGSYKVDSLIVNGNEQVKVRFANIMDLTTFVSYGMVRFVDPQNKENIVDIPLKNLGKLYKASSKVIDGVPEGIRLTDLDTFSVCNGKIAKDGFAIYGYIVNELSEELADIMRITSQYDKLSMNDKIEALEDINLLNYQKTKEENKNGGRMAQR